MDVKKALFISLVILFPMTVGLTASSVLLHQEIDRNRQETHELKKTVLSLHGLTVPSIPSANVDGRLEKGNFPSLPSVRGEAAKSRGSRKTAVSDSAGSLQHSGDNIRLIDGEKEKQETLKTGITLLDG